MAVKTWMWNLGMVTVVSTTGACKESKAKDDCYSTPTGYSSACYDDYDYDDDYNYEQDYDDDDYDEDQYDPECSEDADCDLGAVSYTHLTLPTIYSV